jgi:hypothetical protein
MGFGSWIKRSGRVFLPLITHISCKMHGTQHEASAQVEARMTEMKKLGKSHKASWEENILQACVLSNACCRQAWPDRLCELSKQGPGPIKSAAAGAWFVIWAASESRVKHASRMESSCLGLLRR